jgi:hypothetical protein
MFALALIARIMLSFGVDVDATILAIAGAVNLGLTVPDLFIWNNIYSHYGGKFLIGGRYLRPFISGAIPWTASVLPIYFIIYSIVRLLSDTFKR